MGARKADTANGVSKVCGETEQTTPHRHVSFVRWQPFWLRRSSLTQAVAIHIMTPLIVILKLARGDLYRNNDIR